MDNTIDNLSIINEDKFYSNEEKSIKVIKKQNNIDINQKEHINDVFDFDKIRQICDQIDSAKFSIKYAEDELQAAMKKAAEEKETKNA